MYAAIDPTNVPTSTRGFRMKRRDGLEVSISAFPVVGHVTHHSHISGHSFKTEGFHEHADAGMILVSTEALFRRFVTAFCAEKSLFAPGAVRKEQSTCPS